MEPASHVVWRRCVSLWRRGRISCNMVPLFRRISAFSALSRTTSPHSAGYQCAPLSWSSVIMSQCAPTSCPMRTLCVSPQSLLCWSCQAVVSRSELFCPSCSSLQPLDEAKDFFQILGCDRSFNIDIQELQKKYRNLQRLLHPDYFSQKSQHEQEISEKHSSLVNKAYNTLLSPLRRGIYLLSLHGITFTEGTEGGVDAPFLFEILEINEQLNESNSDAEIEEIGIFIQAKCQSLTESIRDSLQKGSFNYMDNHLLR
ncbi:iron-sulfur cluster co-chaperone protein HscB isoform X2 [Mixophyes fleayi]|uniref:iron-sulfur cluster co-chaperone protein HscB isoform X2 n=1 Tax=Mixophyes fleayi TaxID=3061075 RepID=UPI003F4DFC4C